LFKETARVALDPTKQRAQRYRDIAAEARARADTMTTPSAQEGMIAAAIVWEQLADLEERLALPLASQRRRI